MSDFVFDREKMLHLPVSEMPDGATGTRKISEDEVLNGITDPLPDSVKATIDDDSPLEIPIVSADAFLSTIVVPGTYSLPRTLNTTEWWDVFNQGSIGSCFGCSDSQTATGVNWLKTGKVQEFNKFLHYVACQLMADLKGCRPLSLGKDGGSIPTMGLLVAGHWGYCPDELAPDYPRSYAEGLQTFRQLIEDLKNPNSKLRQAMAPYRMDKFIPIKNTAQIRKAKKSGCGFVQLNSLWPKTMDSHPTLISDFTDSTDPNNRHAGGHAYGVLDVAQADAEVGVTDDDFAIANTWGKGNAKGNQAGTQGWGDEGAKYCKDSALQKILDDKMTLCYLKTDMPFVQGSKEQQGPREIPYKSSSWG